MRYILVIVVTLLVAFNVKFLVGLVFVLEKMVLGQ